MAVQGLKVSGLLFTIYGIWAKSETQWIIAVRASPALMYNALYLCM